jgi:hypothetical protein
MNIDILKNKIRYLTNEEGKKTDVLIPLGMWENIIQILSQEITSDSDIKAQLITEFKQSLLDAQEGKTFPLEQLWEGIE